MFKINKNKIYLSLIILISAFFVYPLFQFKFYKTHDGEAHAARFAAYYHAFADGQIPPRWAGNLNFGYGSPLFIFYYPLPGYLASGLHLFNLTYENTFILLMILSFIFASVFFYLWLKEYFRQDVAFIGGLFYALAPYHFLNTFVRGDIAENIAFVFLPLVFLFIEKFTRLHKIKYIIAGSISYALLILSHNGVGLMFSPILLIYSALRAKNKKIFTISLLIFIIGLLLSSYFWLPAIMESKFVNSKLFIGSMYKDHFPAFIQIIYSNWGFGTDVRKAGGLSPQIGLIYIILSFICIIYLKKLKDKKLIIFWIFVFLISVFITLPFSTFIWEKLFILRQYEFPWRFTAASSFAAIILSCHILNKFKNKLLFFIILITLIISSIQYIKINKYETKNDLYYNNYKANTDYHGQAISIWTEGNPWKTAKSPIELIGGIAQVSNFHLKSNLHNFDVTAKTKVQFLDNTIFFPGWTALVDGNKVPIEFQDMNHRGLITFYVPSGKHNIKVKFSESPIRLFSNLLSLLVFIIMLLLTLLVCLKSRRRSHEK